MKVNVEIDCTPLEARQFFGLPDVSPMQVAVMEKLQQQMLANMGVYPRLPGRYDTIYVCLPNDKQEIYAPLLVVLTDAGRAPVYRATNGDPVERTRIRGSVSRRARSVMTNALRTSRPVSRPS